MLLEASDRQGEELGSGRGAAPAAPLAILGCLELNEDVSEKQIRPWHSVLYWSVFKPWQQGHARDRQGCVHDVLSFGSSLLLLFFYIICKQDLQCLDGVGYSLFMSYSGVVPNPWDMTVDENRCFSPLSGWLHFCFWEHSRRLHTDDQILMSLKNYFGNVLNIFLARTNILKRSQKNNFLQKEVKWKKKER